MIDIIQGFRPGSAEPIDNRLVLSKQEMLNVNDKIMPESYFAVCVDDGILYSYDKKNTPNSATGKFVAVTDFIYDVKIKKLNDAGELIYKSVSYIENNKKLADIDLTSYSKSNEVAYTVSLELDNDYKLKSILKNKDGLEISSSEVDFPIETLISAISYDASSKSIKFTLESGLETAVSLSNLVTDTFVAATYATKTELAGKVDKEDGKALSTNDLTNLLKSNYDTAYNHSQSLHARTDATKTEASSNNGYIKINGEDVEVYTHPSGTNPHGLTASDIGLGNVDNTSDTNKPISNAVSEALSKKVDKIDGKVLTSNDFTNSYKEKLDSIAQGANVNVQADWNTNVDTDDSFIKNRPTKLSQFTNDVNYATESSVREQGSRIDALSDKSDSLDAAVKTKADKSDVNSLRLDVQGKANSADVYTKQEANELLSNKQGKLVAGDNIIIADDGVTISAKDTTYKAGAGITINANNEIGTMSAAPYFSAIAGDRDNLYTNEVLATEFNSKVNAEANKSLMSLDEHTKLASVEEGANNYVLPEEVAEGAAKGATAIQEHQSLAAYRTAAEQDSLHDDTKQNIIDESNRLSYSLLSDTPIIPTVPAKVSAFTNDAGYLTEHQDISGKQDKSDSSLTTSQKTIVGGINELKTSVDNKVDKEAGKGLFSGNYDDLEGKPTIPTVNNATLTIQKNGVAVQTFTANASSDAIANISVPTKTSDLTNDSEFTTNKGTVTSVAVKMNNTVKGTITSSGTIDLGTVLTAHQDISNKVDKVDGLGLSQNNLTDTLKLNYDAAYTHTQVAHAKVDATKVEKSSINGNIKIDGVETNVYTEVANTVHDSSYKHINVTETSVSDGTNTFDKYVLPEKYNDTIEEANKIKVNKIDAPISDGSSVYNTGYEGQILTSGSDGTVYWKDGYRPGTGISVTGQYISTTYTICTISADTWVEVKSEEETSTTLYYKADINVPGITEASNPVLDIKIGAADYAQIDQLNEAWSKVYSAETDLGKIIFYAIEKPDIQMSVQVKCY